MSIRIGKTGTVRLTGKDLRELRHAVYERAEGACEACHVPLIEEGGLWSSMHLSHIKSRGAGGSDEISNVLCLCLKCHLVDGHNPKSVPPK